MGDITKDFCTWNDWKLNEIKSKLLVLVTGNWNSLTEREEHGKNSKSPKGTEKTKMHSSTTTQVKDLDLSFEGNYLGLGEFLGKNPGICRKKVESQPKPITHDLPKRRINQSLRNDYLC